MLAMLASLSPAVAADEMSAVPTVEEILSQYHQKAFDAQMQEDSGASTWSLRGGESKTLEQETVDILTEAGYEAYNITADNYDELEAELKTDFTEMGLDPNGSYILVIEGEDEAYTQSAGSNSRTSPEIDLEGPPDHTGDGRFSFTYDGTTYTMRYATVTAADNTALAITSGVELFAGLSSSDIIDALAIPITILSADPLFGASVSITSLILTALPEPANMQHASLHYQAGTNWTLQYIQILDNGEWRNCSSVEYVTLRYFINFTYYDPISNGYEQTSSEGSHGYIYSEYYNDNQYMKERAAIAYEYNDDVCYHDTVDEVQYLYRKPGDTEEKEVITHQRSLYAE